MRNIVRSALVALAGGSLLFAGATAVQAAPDSLAQSEPGSWSVAFYKGGDYLGMMSDYCPPPNVHRWVWDVPSAYTSATQYHAQGPCALTAFYYSGGTGTGVGLQRYSLRVGFGAVSGHVDSIAAYGDA
ncbi:hypothetical protein [Actinoallomurus iriomotensis]|uniref:Uncharacterized protein n=1 Tax=Actinoallomurus iriomotensis TaxID=478107 RepID=A0A9W6VUG5_9ACTN|nr:hypothetical protein [Actinoallomurus iriomotensis]GLY80124.1 hypothetical protein Airi01_083910 [Actinoallomurus iriomotensis]